LSAKLKEESLTRRKGWNWV